MTIKGIPLALAMGLLGLFHSWSQGDRNDPFETTLRTHHRRAWTISAGTSQMMGMPTSVWSSWVVNHGTDDNLVLDTLHMGLWRTHPQMGWRAGLGRLWLRPDGLWADRFTASLHASHSRVQESFVGEVKGEGPDTALAFVDALIWETARATSFELDVQSIRALAKRPQAFLDWRTGLRGAWNVQQSTPNQTGVFFTPAQLPQWHMALSIGLGAGMKMEGGNMMRFTIDVDALQLMQAPTEDVFRPIESDVRGLDWLQSGYRPWRISIYLDMFKERSSLGCGTSQGSSVPMDLFDPKMQRKYKSKVTGLDGVRKSKNK